MNMVFIFTIFGILAGTVTLLIGAIYILRSVGIIHFESVDIPTWLLILILGGSSMVLGMVLSLFVSKFVLKASNRVVEGLDRLASGNFSERINIGKSKAHVQLSNAFNKLAKELEDTKMLRSDFINEFAHEFKTPIVSIKGFAELLADKRIKKEQKEEYINIIVEEADRLAVLASNYLNLTKVEKQNILTDVVKFNVAEQIRSSILLLENKWVKKNLNLSLDLEEISVLGNEEMLKQIWINLIDNAIKFSNDNGELQVKAKIVKGVLLVSIANSGNVINENDLNKIFEKFYRSSENKHVDGSGVGLAIVKKIIDLHKGSVGVESKDGLTTFTVTLKDANKIQVKQN